MIDITSAPLARREWLQQGTAPVRRRAMRPSGNRLVVAAAMLVSAAALVPLGFVIVVAIQTGWETAWNLIVRPRVGHLLVNTVLLEALALPAAMGLALALAWLTERTDLPGAKLWRWLAVAPLAVPAFVHSYAWNGFAPSLHGLPAAVLISVLAYFPFVYLPLAAQLRRLDPAMEEAAASLGYAPWRVFLRATLPQLRLALCGGALLVGLHLLAEYGLYALVRFDTFTTAIMDQFQAVYTGAAAHMMAGVLVACCLVLLGVEGFARGSERYARVGSGAARLPQRHRLGRLALPSLALPALVAVLSLGVPVATLGRWLWLGGLDAWQSLVGTALIQTAGYAAAAAVLTAAAALPIAWLSVRAPGPLQRAMEACHAYVGSLPGVVVALAVVTITVRVALPLYQTAAAVLFAYALLFLPRAMIMLRASIAQAPVELEQAAMALGRPPLQAVLRTTLPLAAPGAAAAMALVAMGVTTELTATLMLAPNGTRTLASQFWALTSEIDYVGAAPYALMMIVLSLPLMMILQAQSHRAAGR